MRAGLEPAAMMQCSKAIDSVPSAVSTASSCGDVKRAGAAHDPHLALLGQRREATGEPLDGRAGRGAQLVEIDLGLAEVDADLAGSRASASTLATCSRAFDGMQPTLRQTPPSRECRSTRVTPRPRSAARKAAV